MCIALTYKNTIQSITARTDIQKNLLAIRLLAKRTLFYTQPQ